MNVRLVVSLLLGLFGLLSAARIDGAPPNWPQFRGPNGSGISPDARPPVHFGPETNLAWKASIPGGISAPIVWDRHIFLTAFDGQKLFTLAYEAGSGRELWRRAAEAEKIESCHEFSSPAAPTPCTDGERVYSYFGSFGIIAYNFKGDEVWRRPLDRLPVEHGTASSPILAGGKLVLQRDGDSTNSQVLALEPATGRTLWTAARLTSGGCYSTPMVWKHDGLEELIVQGKGRLTAYQLADGQRKWWVKGWGFSAVATPVEADGLLFAGSAGSGDPTGPPDPFFDWPKFLSLYDANKDGQLALTEVPESVGWHIRKDLPKDEIGNYLSLPRLLKFMDSDNDGRVTKAEWDADEAYAMDKYNADRFVAIRPGGKDDSTESHVTWETTKGISELASPLLYRNRLHFFRDGGMWSILEPKTGQRLVDRERIGIGGQPVASPIAADGRIYVVNSAGTFAVLKAGDTLEVLAVNKLGERVRSTPALAGTMLYVRGSSHLWAFAEK